MHEYHIVENAVNQIVAAAQKNQARRVTRVRFVMGDLAGLEEGAVRLYFETVAKGTVAEGAEIAIQHVKAQLVCADGHAFDVLGRTSDEFHEFAHGNIQFHCPQCGKPGRRNGTGKDFYIDDVEIEQD